RTRFMFIGLAFAVAVGPVAAADRETSKEYTSCLDKAGGVTVEMMDCIGAETKRQDARLNENYKRHLSKLSANRKKALTEAPRAWIGFRDANCRFYYDPDGGSLARRLRMHSECDGGPRHGAQAADRWAIGVVAPLVTSAGP